MSHKISDEDLESIRIDKDDLEMIPAPVLRRIIRAGLGKRAKKKMEEAEYEGEDDEADEAEEEREKLSKMAEEQRGEAPKVSVTKDDLPPAVQKKLKKG